MSANRIAAIFQIGLTKISRFPRSMAALTLPAARSLAWAITSRRNTDCYCRSPARFAVSPQTSSLMSSGSDANSVTTTASPSSCPIAFRGGPGASCQRGQQACIPSHQRCSRRIHRNRRRNLRAARRATRPDLAAARRGETSLMDGGHSCRCHAPGAVDTTPGLDAIGLPLTHVAAIRASCV